MGFFVLPHVVLAITSLNALTAAVLLRVIGLNGVSILRESQRTRWAWAPTALSFILGCAWSVGGTAALCWNANTPMGHLELTFSFLLSRQSCTKFST